MYPIIKFIDIARVSLGGRHLLPLGYAVLHVTLYICLDMLFYIIKALMTQ